MVVSRKEKTNLKVIPGGAKSNIEDDLDALFRLPLAEFIGARKTLAAKLKKEGRASEEERVKALAKPSISAWAVNQLYWHHRELFERLLASGQSIRHEQATSRTGKVDRMREALEARRETLSHLSDSAAALLSEAGHNPTPDMVRRIAATLEAISAYASLPDGLSAGRLTKDIDAPGFDSFASFTPDARATQKAEGGKQKAEGGKQKAEGGKQKAEGGKQKAGARSVLPGATQLKEARQAKLAAAKLSLQDAKKSLADARSRAQSLESSQKKAEAAAKQAEKQKREAEARYKEAIAASTDSTIRAQKINLELERATKVMEDAQRAVERSSKELESLFSES